MRASSKIAAWRRWAGWIRRSRSPAPRPDGRPDGRPAAAPRLRPPVPRASTSRARRRPPSRPGHAAPCSPPRTAPSSVTTLQRCSGAARSRRARAVHLTISRSQTFQTGRGPHSRVGPGRATTTFRRGLRMTTPEQTFIDLAASLDLVELVVLGDRLVRREVTTPQRLVRSADAWRGHHRELACRAAGLVRAGVDSPPESRLRMLVVLAGLPEPTVNHIVRDPDTGEWLRRFELAYRDLLIAIEYEGRQHRDDDEIWAADIERREELDRGDLARRPGHQQGTLRDAPSDPSAHRPGPGRPRRASDRALQRRVEALLPWSLRRRRDNYSDMSDE